MSSKLLEEWKKQDPKLLDIEGFQKFLDERGTFRDAKFMSAEEKKRFYEIGKGFLTLGFKEKLHFATLPKGFTGIYISIVATLPTTREVGSIITTSQTLL